MNNWQNQEACVSVIDRLYTIITVTPSGLLRGLYALMHVSSDYLHNHMNGGQINTIKLHLILNI